MIVAVIVAAIAVSEDIRGSTRRVFMEEVPSSVALVQCQKSPGLLDADGMAVPGWRLRPGYPGHQRRAAPAPVLGLRE